MRLSCFRFAGLIQEVRQRHCREDADDHDHDHQLHQGEAFLEGIAGALALQQGQLEAVVESAHGRESDGCTTGAVPFIIPRPI